MLLARGSSHRTSTDAELIRWGSPYLRVEGRREVAGRDPATLDVSIGREGPSGGRKRVRVNGVGRRATALVGVLRVVIFAPEEMLLVIGSPALRRTALDALASQRFPVYGAHLATYGRALAQRNHLLRAIREEQASPDELPFWTERLVESGAAILEARRTLLAELAAPLAAAHREIGPGEPVLELTDMSSAPPGPGESAADALARRLRETAEKEVWNGTTLVGPHRDDATFRLGGREMAGFASRGQQRSAILALKLAELDLLTAVDGRPPLLLLDDVFSELDPERRGHLVRRIAALPQAFVTTTTLDDLDPGLRDHGVAWRVVADLGTGAQLVGPAGEPGWVADAQASRPDEVPGAGDRPVVAARGPRQRAG